MPDSDFTPALEEFHTVRLKRRSASEQMRHALEAIRDSAATKENAAATAPTFTETFLNDWFETC